MIGFYSNTTWVVRSYDNDNDLVDHFETTSEKAKDSHVRKCENNRKVKRYDLSKVVTSGIVQEKELGTYD